MLRRVAAASKGVLVTGANGNLGRRLLSRLAGERPLRAVVRSARAARQVESLPEAAGIDVSVLDYGDAEGLTRAAADCSHAVHLVGILKEDATRRYRDAHEGTSRALAAAADANGMRRIVYPSIVGADPASANACLASKGRAERILLDARTPALVLRVPMVLGEGDFASRALRARALARFALLPRGGRSLEQPIYAGDVIAAIAAGLEKEDLDDLVLDLAGPESLPHRELVARAAALHGRAPRIVPVPLAALKALAFVLEKLSRDPPLTRPMLEVLDHDDDVDASAACERLGIARTPLDEALRRCLLPEGA
jgi:NADH dehydrogenase